MGAKQPPVTPAAKTVSALKAFAASDDAKRHDTLTAVVQKLQNVVLKDPDYQTVEFVDGMADLAQGEDINGSLKSSAIHMIGVLGSSPKVDDELLIHSIGTLVKMNAHFRESGDRHGNKCVRAALATIESGHKKDYRHLLDEAYAHNEGRTAKRPIRKFEP